MKLVALTGGIGSGKSTVSRLLAERGAVIVDADAIVHDLQRAGQPLLARLAERFGASIIRPDGELDRAGLAAIVFADDAALADLNAIVHPAVRAEMNRRVLDELRSDHVVVLDVPLLNVRADVDVAAVIVVDVPVEEAVRRLVRFRGMDEGDARARIAKQISREERLAVADRVIDNSGDVADLRGQIEDLWAWIGRLPPSTSRRAAEVRAEDGAPA